MSEAKVVVVKTGTANLASVCAALKRLGATPAILERPQEIETAQFLVLPGVGAFSSAMGNLIQQELVEPLRERIERGRPTLAICLGMQLLCERSEEGEGTKGIGAVSGKITRLVNAPRVPQMGWNLITPTDNARLLAPGYVYFANSYCLMTLPEGWSGAMTIYGGAFAAAIERGAVLACQFHPELSGAFGAALLSRWLERGREEEMPC